jgi:hypothetical protein
VRWSEDASNAPPGFEALRRALPSGPEAIPEHVKETSARFVTQLSARRPRRTRLRAFAAGTAFGALAAAAVFFLVHRSSRPPAHAEIEAELAAPRDTTRTEGRPAAAPPTTPRPVPNADVHPEPPAALAVGWLTLMTIPWTTVSVDGRVVGTTPVVRLELAAGTHRVEVRSDDGSTAVLSLTIQPGEHTRKTIQLDDVRTSDDPEPAILQINSSPRSDVWVDGREVGGTPRARLVVEPGEHEIVLVRESQRYTTRVHVGAGETKRIVHRFALP